MAHVLVYGGEGAAFAGLPHAVESLARLGGHAYDVQLIQLESLVRDPWDAVTALLVLPDGAAPAYRAALARAAPRLGAYLRRGGRVLAMGAAAECLCSAPDGAPDGAPSEAPLVVFPGTYRAEACPRGTVRLTARGAALEAAGADEGRACGTFVGGTGGEIAVLATYEGGSPAAVRCAVGSGAALLVGVAATQALVPLGVPPGSGADAARLQTLAAWLQDEGLRLGGAPDAPCGPPSITDPVRLTPVYVASRSDAVLGALRAALVAAASAEVPRSEAELSSVAAVLAARRGALDTAAVVRDTHDVYTVLDARRGAADALAALHEACLDAEHAAYGGADTDWRRVPKYVVLVPRASGVLDDVAAGERVAPFFVLPRYFAALDAARAALRARALPWPKAPPSVAVGDAVGYVQVATSTQTLLEQNRALLHAAAPGTTLVATHQVAGRGRGRNAWISPCGCLQFSTRLALPARAGAKSVFLQYLAALAIVYGLSEGLGAAGDALRGRLRVKWPNDVYAEVADAPAGCVRRELGGVERRFVKIGGILVNAQYTEGHFDLVVGCGVNVTNAQPTTSVAEVVRQFGGGAGDVTQERCAAAIFAALERVLSAFEAAAYDFAPFAAAYRAVWLHDDQEVTLDGARMRVVGVTRDYGLLRTVPHASPLRAGDAGAWGAAPVAGSVDVQPDGNSFDMLQNLVRSK